MIRPKPNIWFFISLTDTRVCIASPSSIYTNWVSALNFSNTKYKYVPSRRKYSTRTRRVKLGLLETKNCSAFIEKDKTLKFNKLIQCVNRFHTIGHYQFDENYWEDVRVFCVLIGLDKLRCASNGQKVPIVRHSIKIRTGS